MCNAPTLRYMEVKYLRQRLGGFLGNGISPGAERVIDFAVEIGFHILNLEYSPIKGPEGNIEYLVYIRKEAKGSREESVDVHAVVEAAHGELDK